MCIFDIYYLLQEGRTALHCLFCMDEDDDDEDDGITIDIAKLLLQQGADINIQDKVQGSQLAIYIY